MADVDAVPALRNMRQVKKQRGDIPSDESQAAGGGEFESTEWSIVLAAGASGERKRQALEQLCLRYWQPVYGYIRRLGYDSHQAKDHTQAFFVHLLAQDFFATADPERGRLRGYICHHCRLFLGNEWQKHTAEKRGGGQADIPWEALTVEEERQFAAPGDPRMEFDRQWTLTLLRNALARLEAEQATPAARKVFGRLSPYLTNRPGAGEYEKIAQDLAVAPGNVPVLVHRLSKRYQELIRAEVAATLSARSDIDAELRHCLQALG